MRIRATAALAKFSHHYATTTELTVRQDNGAVVDLAAVERAINGIPVNLNDDEAYEAARLLNGLGYQPQVIAARVGAHVRRVARWKAAGWPESRPGQGRGRRAKAAA